MAAINTRAWVGAVKGEPKGFFVSVFVPSQTRDGVAIDHAAWKTQTIEEMAKLFRGATAIEGDGGWRDDDQGGGIIVEKVSMVFSLMAKSDWNKKTAAQ